MKKARLAFISAIAIILATGQLRAAVRVTAEPEEKVVALQVAGKRYVTTNPHYSLDLSGAKIGSKQTFTLVDLNGEDLADGDEVKIRYTPNSDGKPDFAKSSYWVELTAGVKRDKEGSVFKIKRVDSKYAFVAPSGKFVAGPVAEGVLGLSEKLEGALLVDLVDLSQGIPKKGKKAAAE